MSLYSALFGQNVLAPILLSILGTTREQVPRFRDCFLAVDGNDLTGIAIYTRTGGGNRPFYESAESQVAQYGSDLRVPEGPFNADLRKLPGFLYDLDDEYDNTYATFFYAIPDEVRPMLDVLASTGIGNEKKPAEKFQQLLTDLGNQKETPETAHALEVGLRIFGQINAAMKEERDAGNS